MRLLRFPHSTTKKIVPMENLTTGDSSPGTQYSIPGWMGPNNSANKSAVEEVMALKARTAYWNDLSAPNSPLLKYFRQLIFRQERSRLGAKVAVTKLVPKPYVNVIGIPADFAQAPKSMRLLACCIGTVRVSLVGVGIGTRDR